MFTKHFIYNMKQKTDRQDSQHNKSAAWKVETEITACYSDEYATDITEILNKTIFREVP